MDTSTFAGGGFTPDSLQLIMSPALSRLLSLPYSTVSQYPRHSQTHQLLSPPLHSRSVASGLLQVCGALEDSFPLQASVSAQPDRRGNKLIVNRYDSEA